MYGLSETARNHFATKNFNTIYIGITLNYHIYSVKIQVKMLIKNVVLDFLEKFSMGVRLLESMIPSAL